MKPISIPHDELIPSEETQQIIIDAVKSYVDSARQENEERGGSFSLQASGTPWSRSYGVYMAALSVAVLPVLLAEFLAYMARKRDRGENPEEDPTGAVFVWPEGVDMPTTVNELYDIYPWIFDGVPRAATEEAGESSSFLAEVLLWFGATVAVLSEVPRTAYAQMLDWLKKFGPLSPEEQAAKTREWFAWDPDAEEGWSARARNMAKTEVHSARQSAGFAAAQDHAKRGAEIVKVWMTAGDDRVRDIHRAAHEQERPLEQTFDVGGESLLYPGDKVHGSPGNTINCRCDAVYYDKKTGQTIITASGRKHVMSDNKKARPWEGRLAPIGEKTGDGRMLVDGGEFRFREFPLPLLFQDVTSNGHDNSRIVGVIESGEITPDGIEGRGVVYADEERVLRLLEDKVLRPSVDMCDVVFEVDEQTADEEVMVMTSGAVMGATLVATPAFENVNVSLTDAAVEEVSIVAAAAPALPTYRAENFMSDGLPSPTPLTLDRETGVVYGHLALWDSCHVGMPGKCVSPPRSRDNYASFHQSTILTDDGRLAVGRLTVGGGHADPNAGLRAAADHYDTTGATWAFVRAGEDKHGIFVCGEINPAATASQLAAAETAPLSGDWRRRGAGLELIAALSVSVPGFPVRREFRADGDTVDSLVASADVASTCSGDEPDADSEVPNDGFSRGVRYSNVMNRLEGRFSADRRARFERVVASMRGEG